MSNIWAVATCAAVVIVARVEDMGDFLDMVFPGISSQELKKLYMARWTDTLQQGPGEEARRILVNLFCQPFKDTRVIWAAGWEGTGGPEPWQLSRDQIMPYKFLMTGAELVLANAWAKQALRPSASSECNALVAQGSAADLDADKFEQGQER